MERQDQNVRSDLYTVDLLHILKRLWYRIWAIALCGIIGAVACSGLPHEDDHRLIITALCEILGVDLNA